MNKKYGQIFNNVNKVLQLSNNRIHIAYLFIIVIKNGFNIFKNVVFIYFISNTQIFINTKKIKI
jgi:hypothetical protein